MAGQYLEIYKGTERLQDTTGLRPGDLLTVVVREDLYPGHKFVAWVDRDGNPLDPYPEGGVTEEGYPYFYFRVTCDAYFNALFRPEVTEPVTITPVPNDPELGSTDGGGTVEVGTIVDIVAYDIPCYSRFVEWRKKSTGEFASYNNPYSVVANENRIYEAIFEPIEYTINLRVNNRFLGSATQSGEKYHLGDTVILTAEAESDCTFVGWFEDDNLLSEDLEFEYTIEKIGDEECKEERNILAKFTGNLYEVIVHTDMYEIPKDKVYII